jgi:hypothetical protein
MFEGIGVFDVKWLRWLLESDRAASHGGVRWMRSAALRYRQRYADQVSCGQPGQLPGSVRSMRLLPPWGTLKNVTARTAGRVPLLTAFSSSPGCSR